MPLSRPAAPPCGCWQPDCPACGPWQEYHAWVHAELAAGRTPAGVVAAGVGAPGGPDPRPPERPAASHAPAPCFHLGEELTVRDKERLGLPLHKSWAPCAQGLGRGGYACSCEGCGPGCPKYATAPEDPDRVVVNLGCGGVGDAILGLYAVKGLGRENPERHLTYRVGPRAKEFVGLFDGYDELAAHEPDRAGHLVLGGPARQMNAGYLERELAGRGAATRLDRYLANVGARAAARPELRDPAGVRALGRAYADCVVLAPLTAGSDREYSLPGWRAVERLLRARGWRTAILHKDTTGDRPPAVWLQGLASEVLLDRPAAEVAGILANAACFVGVDSGLTHLAHALGTPTVVLEGQTRAAQVFAEPEALTVLDGVLGCGGCYWQRGAGHDVKTCAPLCPNVQSITPDRIALAADERALRHLTGDRTLVSPDRLMALRDHVRATAGVDGDLAEVGVYRGGTARLIGRLAPTAALHLFDTFAGVPEDDESPGGHARGDFADTSYEEVNGFLGPRPKTWFYVGAFPKFLPAEGTRYRLVHLDGDTYQTTRDALAYFAPRMAPGGRVVLDDHGWHRCRGVDRALREAGLAAETSARFQSVVKF